MRQCYQDFFFFFFFELVVVGGGMTDNSIFFAIREIGELNSSPSLFWVGTRKVKVKKFYSFIRVPNMPWSPFEVFTNKVIKAYHSHNHFGTLLKGGFGLAVWKSAFLKYVFWKQDFEITIKLLAKLMKKCCFYQLSVWIILV